MKAGLVLHKPDISSATLEKSGGFVFRHYEKSAPIGARFGAQITRDLAEGLPRFGVEQYFGSQPTIFDDYDHAVVAFDPQGRAIGLLGGCWLGDQDLTFFYLWTMMVADKYRHSRVTKGILSHFITEMAAHCGLENMPRHVVTKTYNPRVYELLKSLCMPKLNMSIYPEIPSAKQDPERAGLATRIVSSLKGDLPFDAESGTVFGGQAMVAPDFFPLMEQANSEDVNVHFQKHLTRNDQILCVLDVPAEAWPVLSRGRRRARNSHPALTQSAAEVY